QGRACIHPDQVAVANEVFGTDPAALADAHALSRLAASADAAYIHGMNLALLVCGVAALVSALLVMTLLPDSREPDSRGPGSREPGSREPGSRRGEDKSTRGGPAGDADTDTDRVADREREAVRESATARETATAGKTEGDAGVAPAPADAGQ
ncbi:hypothetical protein AB0H70_33185, partial [Streptomyces sp. NPDC050804]